MADLVPSEHHRHDELDRVAKSTLTQLNSPFPDVQAEAEARAEAWLAAAAQGDAFQEIIRDLEQNGPPRTKEAIGRINQRLFPAGLDVELPQRLAGVGTESIPDLVSWVRTAGRNVTISKDPRFAELVTELRLRALHELPDDTNGVRTTFKVFTSPPFPPALNDRDLTEIAKHLIPGAQDTHAIKDDKARGVLFRRIPETSNVGPFIDQLTLATSDPTMTLGTDSGRRVIMVLDRLPILDADRVKLRQLTLFLTNQYLDGAINLTQLGRVVEATQMVTRNDLGTGQSFAEFADTKDRLRAAIGSPPLANLADPELRHATTLSRLAQFSGLHVDCGRVWLAEAIEVAKQAEAKTVSEERFRAVWNFGEPLFLQTGFELELAAAVRAEETHFRDDGLVWDILESFCEEAEDNNGTVVM